MTLRIGITGNIGAGKSTVCREFARLGIPTYYADIRAKELMAENAVLRRSIIAAFGPETYTAEGALDRAYLSSVVFGDEAALTTLNRLVHPAVAKDAAKWHDEQSTPYTLHEAAILYEIGAQEQYDAIVVVSCPEPIRQARVMLRDGVTEAAFRERAARQWSDAQKEAAADYLIRNDGSSLLFPQLLRVDRKLRARVSQTAATRT
jgi:dephospho-CoA kinase